MNKPQLIAETPRAGKWNHRFIAAPDGSLSDSEIKKILAAARSNPQGDDYLAVSVETAESGRTGKEILVLVGVDVKKLSESQRQQIVTQLKQRLPNLATLVTEIDWDRAILLRRRELGEWEKGFGDLPIFVPETEQNNRIWWFVTIISVVAIIAVLFGSYAYWLKGEGDKSPPPNDYQEFLSRLEAFGWQIPNKTPINCRGDQNTAMSPAECELRQLRDESEIEQDLNDLANANSALDVALMFVDDRQFPRVYLEKDLTNFSGMALDKIVETRDTLRNIFSDFRDVAVSLEEKCRLDSSQYSHLSFACRVAKNAQNSQPPQKENDILPFFSQSDVRRVQLLKEVTDKAREYKVMKVAKNATVFKALCVLGKLHKRVKLGISIEMEKAKIDDGDFKKMTENVTNFLQRLSNAGLECDAN